MNPILSSKVHLIGDINGVVWMWKFDNDSFDSKQSEGWTAYQSAISTKIEQAYGCDVSQIHIDKNNLIDFKTMMQVNINDAYRSCLVKRCTLSSLDDNNNIDWRRERFAFRLNQPVTDSSKTNTSEDDVKYYGSRFIADWALIFTDGKLKVEFDIIFPVLVHGIYIEGQLYGAPEKTVKWLIDELEKVKDNVKRKPDFKRIKCLAKCCVNLYTKDWFLFRLVNRTLRDDDRAKLNTLGPYCYLVYNYIGCHTRDYLSIRNRLRQQFHPKKLQSLLVFRGDVITSKKLDEYQQAVRQRHKYFRWLSFVSTSHERTVAEGFATNVLYVIELRRAISNDQFADLSGNTFIPDEEEVLLRPGVRFRIDRITFDLNRRWHVVHIKIAPSFISN